MTRSVGITNHQRVSLMQAILDEIKSWPELHRLVFMRSHYQGSSIQHISSALGLSECEVHSILQHCERQLRASLKAFKECGLTTAIPADVNAAILSSSSWYH